MERRCAVSDFMTMREALLQDRKDVQDSLDDLAERYGAEITDNIELVRALRWQIDHYKGKARELQEMIDDLEETNEGLRDDNGNLRAMVSTAYRKLFGPQVKEVA